MGTPIWTRRDDPSDCCHNFGCAADRRTTTTVQQTAANTFNLDQYPSPGRFSSTTYTMELINQLLRSFLALWLLTLTDAQGVTVTIGEFATGVFVEWVGYFSAFPGPIQDSGTFPIQAFYSNAVVTAVFANPAYNCK